MKVSYYEDLANRVDPEPHGGCSNTTADALVGEDVGGLLSSENTTIRVPTLLSDGEGHIWHSVIASNGRTLRSLRTWHALKPHARESGGPEGSLPRQAGIGESRIQKSPVHRRRLCFDENDEHENRVPREWWAGEGEMPYCRFKMPFGSRTQHSTVEAGEQEDMSTSAEPVEGRA